MRVMLQNTETGLYYAGPKQWTKDLWQALDFGSVEIAVAIYKQEKVSFASILVEDGPSIGGLLNELPDEQTKTGEWSSKF